jgi:dihydrofolate synthase/folylpolyglutamate synthase
MPFRTKTRPAAKSRKTVSARSVVKRPVSKVVATVRRANTVTIEPIVRSPTASTAYDKAMKFLGTLSDFERLRIVRYNETNFDLNRMRSLLRKLGNPQDQLRCIHIAGTKGKGSTCTMIAAMLEAQGYRVGLYTSPHLVDIRERISINGQLISQDDFAKCIRLVEPIAKKLKPLPTWFDVVTAAALKYFADQKIDVAVVETGLGGRLDSTNVIKPEVTAITSISFDHMAQLGNTLAKIAGEKAGIFKPGVPALTVAQVPEVEAVFKRVAGEVGAPLDICGSTIEFSYRFEASRLGGRQYRVCLTTNNSKFEHITVPLFGEHQAINCGLAMAVIDRLKQRGLPIDDSKAIEGLSRTRIAGRMETVSSTPRIIVDAAHNAASIDAFMRAVGQHVPYDSMVVIFGCCADKDVEGMLGRIAGGADKVIFTRVNNIRTANPHELAMRYTEQYGKMAQVADTLRDALEIAYRAVTKEDLICITGSFYLVGEAKKMLADKVVNPSAPIVPILA